MQRGYIQFMKFYKALPTLVLAPILLLFSGVNSAEEASSVNLRTGVTDISNSVFDLHMYALWVCVVIAVVVYGVMFWSLFKYRKSRGVKAAKFTHSTTMELVWTVIPIIILIALIFPSLKVLRAMYDSDSSEINILVTGYQWKWKYEYIDHGFSYFSNLSTDRDSIYKGGKKSETYLLEVDNELVIPIGKKVRFLVTSNDVLHSWWVPDFAVKRDAVPGYVNDAWAIVNEEGIYRGQCTELCGKDHAYMPVVVKAVSVSEYEQWIASKVAEIETSSSTDILADVSQEDLLAHGERIYEVACAACHQSTGQGNPPVFPALTGNELVTASDPSEIIKAVYFGRKGTAMQAFGEQMKITEVASVISYVRNSWGNKAPVVQPAHVAEQLTQ